MYFEIVWWYFGNDVWLCKVCLLTEVCHRDIAARFDIQVVFWRFCCYRWKCISLMSTADCNDVPDREQEVNEDSTSIPTRNDFGLLWSIMCWVFLALK